MMKLSERVRNAIANTGARTNNADAIAAEVAKLEDMLFGADGVLEWLEGDSEPWATEADAQRAHYLQRRIEALES